MQPEQFFQDHQTLLEENYPGISLRIWNEWFRFNNWHNIENLEDRLKSGEPLEYIFEKGYFFNTELYLNNHVLIPRFETEVLVEEALMLIRSHQIKKIADIGTGSGAIGLAILKEIENLENFYFCDINENALAVAEKNYIKLKNELCLSEVSFLCQDRMGNLDNLDLIVTNPPYIPSSQAKSNVHKNVDHFEPEIALYIEDQDYDNWFQIFFSQAFHALNPLGFFLMEGHEDIVVQQEKQLYDVGFTQVHIIKDLLGKNRHLCAQK